jgi:hypothetical protein
MMLERPPSRSSEADRLYENGQLAPHMARTALTPSFSPFKVTTRKIAARDRSMRRRGSQ